MSRHIFKEDPMKFLLVMHTHPSWDSLSPEAQDGVFQQHEAFQRELEAEGAFVASYDLAPASEATTVHRDSSGGFTVAPGLLAGEADSVGGFYVIEAASNEEAVAWARKGRFIEGANEIRPIPDPAA
jgi:hypothetical protein